VANLRLYGTGVAEWGKKGKTGGLGVEVFGVLVAVATGQTVMHCHCHVIPRYVGDVKEQRGGGAGGCTGEEKGEFSLSPSAPELLSPEKLVIKPGSNYGKDPCAG
jgi:hypothetical protein